MVLALVVPLWLLIAASALQLIPELRGEWMFDPMLGTMEFVEYGFFAQWFRGGVVATGILGLASPLLAFVVLVATGANAVGRRRDWAENLRYEGAAGEAALDVPLVVRKRKRGAAEAAIPIAVVEASALRRLLARLVDLALLLGAMGGGVLVGVLATAGTLDWGQVAWTWPLVGAVFAAMALCAVQWAGVIDRGQTLGKILFDTRSVELQRDVAPAWFRGVVLRHVVPELTSATVAAAMAVGVGSLAVLGIREAGVDALFLVDVFRVVVAVFAWPVLFVGLELLRSANLVFGSTIALHDRLAGTHVVRTAVGDLEEGTEAPLGFRILARVLDGAVTQSLVLLPTAVAAILVQGAALPQGVLLGGLAFGILCGLGFQIWQWTSLARTGTTLGKRRVGLVVERVDGKPPNFAAMVMVREWVGMAFLGSLFPVIWPMVDAVMGLGEDARCGHDRIASTRVVWASAAGAEAD